MSTDKEWNDESRQDLQSKLHEVIKGHLRLAKRSHEEILQACHESYILDDVPENEQDAFIQFASEEFDREANQLEREKSGWPAVTDCDRLDRVEAKLRDQGILLWQASPCCDNCTYAELSDRLDLIDSRYPGFRERFRGFTFFIDQNLPQSLFDSTQLSICFAYGWYSPDETETPPEEYKKHAIEIAHEVCRSLRDEGFEVDWNGDMSRKFCIHLNWQRRTLLQ